MKILIILALAACATALSPGVTNCEVDIIFVLDVSGSISNPEFNLMKEFVSSTVAELNIEDDLARVGAVRFGTNVYPGWELVDYTGDPAGVQGAIAGLQHEYDGSTNIGIGIVEMTDMFNTLGRPGVPWVGVVVTDGHSTHGNTTAAATIAHLTTRMIAVGVGSGYNLEELNIIASAPEYVLEVGDFSELVSIIDEVVEISCAPNGGLYVCQAYAGLPYGPVVKTFDGLYAPIFNEQKTTMFRGKSLELGNLDPCKTQIRCVTTYDTWWNRDYEILHLDWCGVALNVHPNPDKNHRNWILGQTLNHISERGQGLKGDTLLYFSDHPDGVIPYPGLSPEPYRTPACDPQQEAQVVGTSITITSPCCNWCVVWTPRVGCSSIDIIMDGTWAGQTEGMCGNSDGVLQNDWAACDSTCTAGDYQCLSNTCQGGPHNAQAFVGGTRIHEDFIDSNPPPDACF